MRQIWICLTAAALASPIGSVEAKQEPTIGDRIRAAMNLPAIVDSIRRRGGIPEGELRAIIEDARQRRIPASETHDVLKQADDAIRDHGPVDNFGAFVQARLAAGLRGRALAQAIRAEHSRRGIGKGQRRGATMGGRSGAQDTAGRARGKAADQPGKRPESPGSKGRGDTTKGKGKGRP